ncbi:hypothetical protein TrST_g11732 [Triparma strigata]|uniref:Methyltransferase type 11 domain-containing protein n=2 Tax=Triparma strigata TaxID=1606541 RepID=A0A9W7C147_9STRA|nr:hypothetical protein TrST_g11732 [Triparma strigata]
MTSIISAAADAPPTKRRFVAPVTQTRSLGVVVEPPGKCEVAKICMPSRLPTANLAYGMVAADKLKKTKADTKEGSMKKRETLSVSSVGGWKGGEGSSGSVGSLEEAKRVRRQKRTSSAFRDGGKSVGCRNLLRTLHGAGRLALVLALVLLLSLAPSCASSDDFSWSSSEDKGLEALQMGDVDTAIHHLEQAADEALTYLSKTSAPPPSTKIQISSLYTNYATALTLSSPPSFSLALQYYQTSLSLHPTMDATYYLALTYQDLSLPHLSIPHYLSLLNSHPTHWESSSNLASAYHDTKSYSLSYLQYEHAISLLESKTPPINPTEEPIKILSDLYYRHGLSIIYYNNDSSGTCTLKGLPVNCDDLCRNSFSKSLDFMYNVEAEHYLKTLTEGVVTEKTSPEYVRKLFNDYAVNFEESLTGDLKYRGFEILGEIFEREVEEGYKGKVVDLGCGTGLVGEEFKRFSKHLTCVDLSEKIIERCKELRPGLYDEYVQGDFLEDLMEADLFVAGDSLIYIGDLRPLFKRMFDMLSYGGYVAITLERGDTESWKLSRSGRFQHSESYVVSGLEEVGFNVVKNERMDGFRMERGKDVLGNVYIAVKERHKKAEL